MIRLLVVEDDADIRAVLEATLRQDFEVLTAANGLDALERLERVEPDFLLLDVAMPCLNGFDTARSIRKNAHFRETPILFLTAQTDAASRELGQEMKAARYFAKPFEPEKLRREVLDFVEREGLTGRSKCYEVDQILAAEREGRVLTPDRAESGLAQLRREPPPDAPPKPRVMIIDDEPDVALLIEKILHYTYETLSSTHSVEALQRIVEAQPDIIMLDVEMPNLSGYQLSQLLKLNPALRQIRIVFVSSRDQPREVDYGFKLGAAGYVTKPFTAEELLEAVQRVVGDPEFSVRSKKWPIDQVRQSSFRRRSSTGG